MRLAVRNLLFFNKQFIEITFYFLVSLDNKFTNWNTIIIVEYIINIFVPIYTYTISIRKKKQLMNLYQYKYPFNFINLMLLTRVVLQTIRDLQQDEQIQPQAALNRQNENLNSFFKKKPELLFQKTDRQLFVFCQKGRSYLIFFSITSIRCLDKAIKMEIYIAQTSRVSYALRRSHANRSSRVIKPWHKQLLKVLWFYF